MVRASNPKQRLWDWQVPRLHFWQGYQFWTFTTRKYYFRWGWAGHQSIWAELTKKARWSLRRGARWLQPTGHVASHRMSICKLWFVHWRIGKSLQILRGNLLIFRNDLSLSIKTPMRRSKTLKTKLLTKRSNNPMMITVRNSLVLSKIGSIHRVTELKRKSMLWRTLSV